MPIKLQRLIRWLRRHYPLQRKLIIRVCKPNKLPGCHGIFEIDDEDPSKAIIRIVFAPEPVMMDTLLEEYAHAIRHETPVPIAKEHDAVFWGIFGQLTMHYRGGDD
jgi:hypothetical protein